MEKDLKLILGSGSPRRKQLLQDLGFNFEVRVSDADETAPSNLSAEETVRWVAESKAKALLSSLSKHELLLTADTEVWQDDHRFGKPAHRGEAVEMIQKLSGSKHKVISGFCLTNGDIMYTYHVSTRVFFKELSQEQIDFYIDTFKPYDKAGAYGIQEWIGMTGIDRIEGSYFNVVGLPTAEVWQALKAWPERAI